jgi:hypothetical protein
MGQDKPGALQDWLGSKNRARAESIAEKIFGFGLLNQRWH